MAESDIHCNVLQCRRPLSTESQVITINRFMYSNDNIILGMCHIMFTYD